MKKEIGNLSINSTIEVSGNRYYIIDKDFEREIALIQSECGHITNQITFECEVDVIKEFPVTKIRGFEPVSECGRNNTLINFKDKGFIVPVSHIMPLRGSKVSAGYDISVPVELVIPSGKKVKVFTNVKAYMKEGEFLFADVRSSIGINDDVVLANTIGIIDMDYYNNPKNEGNIAVVLKNNSDKDVTYKPGERLCQLIFLPFLVSDNCNSKSTRTGGLGSTGR